MWDRAIRPRRQRNVTYLQDGAAQCDEVEEVADDAADADDGQDDGVGDEVDAGDVGLARHVGGGGGRRRLGPRAHQRRLAPVRVEQHAERWVWWDLLTYLLVIIIAIFGKYMV